jgi:hypothetical protein
MSVFNVNVIIINYPNIKNRHWCDPQSKKREGMWCQQSGKYEKNTYMDSQRPRIETKKYQQRLIGGKGGKYLGAAPKYTQNHPNRNQKISAVINRMRLGVQCNNVILYDLK